jgi:isopenicillin N synthase-like dioxygenase
VKVPAAVEVSECELPMIDIGWLTSGDAGSAGCVAAAERAACVAAIARAAEEWGFFQVRNHGLQPELLEAMRREQARLFRLPVEAKQSGLLDASYRWGTPTAMSLQQLCPGPRPSTSRSPASPATPSTSAASPPSGAFSASIYGVSSYAPL